MSATGHMTLMQIFDDAWNIQDWETFRKRHAKDVAVYWPGQNSQIRILYCRNMEKQRNYRRKAILGRNRNDETTRLKHLIRPGSRKKLKKKRKSEIEARKLSSR